MCVFKSGSSKVLCAARVSNGCLGEDRGGGVHWEGEVGGSVWGGEADLQQGRDGKAWERGFCGVEMGGGGQESRLCSGTVDLGEQVWRGEADL